MWHHCESVSASERQDEEQMPRETGTRQGRTPPTGDPHRREDPAENPPPEGRATQGTHTEHTQTASIAHHSFSFQRRCQRRALGRSAFWSRSAGRSSTYISGCMCDIDCSQPVPFQRRRQRRALGRLVPPFFGAVRPGEAASIHRDVCVTSTAHNFLSFQRRCQRCALGRLIPPLFGAVPRWEGPAARGRGQRGAGVRGGARRRAASRLCAHREQLDGRRAQVDLDPYIYIYIYIYTYIYIYMYLSL